MKYSISSLSVLALLATTTAVSSHNRDDAAQPTKTNRRRHLRMNTRARPGPGYLPFGGPPDFGGGSGGGVTPYHKHKHRKLSRILLYSDNLTQKGVFIHHATRAECCSQRPPEALCLLPERLGHPGIAVYRKTAPSANP